MNGVPDATANPKGMGFSLFFVMFLVVPYYFIVLNKLFERFIDIVSAFDFFQ